MAEAKSDDVEMVAAPSAAPAVPKPLSIVAPRHLPGAGYGQRRFNLPAIVVTVGLHAVLIGALIHIRHEVDHTQPQRLAVVDLRPAPPPPPPPRPAKEQPTQAPKAAVIAPVPLLQVPRPAPPIVTATEPVREPVEISVPAPLPPAPAAPPSTVKASDLGTRMISGDPPRYPVECRKRREQGTVVLALTLDLEGAVSSISIARSSGFSRLDDAALRAVRKWRWAPTLRDGQPVMVKGQVEIPFVLQG